ncbi:unnamed protein product [Camellia sinensis]
MVRNGDFNLGATKEVVNWIGKMSAPVMVATTLSTLQNYYGLGLDVKRWPCQAIETSNIDLQVNLEYLKVVLNIEGMALP